MVSKRITIPLGPQHPFLSEPGCFMLTIEDEKVVKAEIGIGYNHRGLEKLCEQRSYLQDLYLLERISGICSHTNAICYAGAVETLAGVEIPPRAKFIRVIVAELERLHSHLLWLGFCGRTIGLETLLMAAWRDREQILDMLAMLGGNRVHCSINTLGGVRRDLSPTQAESIAAVLTDIDDRAGYYIELLTTDAIIRTRLEGIGVLSREDALRYGVVGPVCRASGVQFDVRAAESYLAYGEIPFNMVTSERGDAFGRAMVRLHEMRESVAIIRYALAHLPEGPLTVAVPRHIPSGEALSRVEGPRGETVHYVRSDGTPRPDRVHVRAATTANWPVLERMLAGSYLADVPVIVASMDPSYAAMERLLVVNGQPQSTTWTALARAGEDFYRRRGASPEPADRLPQQLTF